MECNKDEASRAKEIAEKKFSMKDVIGAKRFALKAKALYPDLEGIPQMLATFDVYLSAENKINGESDWYGILGVNAQADDETVRKQYRKLALMLHPDKNKSVGADGAFKFVSEAWSLLSDKGKRAAYDQKRNAKVMQKVSSSSGGPSAPPGANGFYNFAKSTTSNARPPKSTQRASHSSSSASSHKPPSQKPKPNTFWTVCHRCKMQYEYLRVYLNHNLLCPNCHEPFLASEIAPPSSKLATPWCFSRHSQQTSHHQGGKSTNNSGRNAAPPNVGTAGVGSSDPRNQYDFAWSPFSGASSAARAASLVQQTYEKVKREREEAQAATKREEGLKRKQQASKKAGGGSSSGNAAKRRKDMEDVSAASNITNQMGVGTGGAGTANLSGSKQFNFETGRVNGVSTREFSQVEISKKVLIEKAKKEIGNKLKEWHSASATKTAAKEEENGHEKGEKTFAGDATQDQNKSGESTDRKNGVHSVKSFPHPSGKIADTLDTMSINVPDPDFHDFDKDRTEQCFGENQVWAAYDGDDGMPRYYAMIHSVISLNPFKMRISWLNSKTNSELGPLNWIASGFSKTCGDFRVGKHEIYNSLNSFSHKVRWTKGTRGIIRIYPRKGDVWALYRNWSSDWNELTADEVIHKYDMVEVLEDYSEELGVTVAPLVKVAGFKTVFHRHLDPKQVRTIPREEMFRFSHHVPSYLLSGQEASHAPKGCRELDPAATPFELLQVVTAVEQEILESEETVEEVNAVDNAEKADDKEVAENCQEAGKEEKGDFMDIQESEVVKDIEETKHNEGVDPAEEMR